MKKSLWSFVEQIKLPGSCRFNNIIDNILRIERIEINSFSNEKKLTLASPILW